LINFLQYQNLYRKCRFLQGHHWPEEREMDQGKFNITKLIVLTETELIFLD
jgi:hypothetical protein